MERGTGQALQETNDRLRGRETAIRASLSSSRGTNHERARQLASQPASQLTRSLTGDLSDKGSAVRPVRCYDAKC